MNTLSPYMKATVAFLTPGLTTLGLALQATSEGGSTVTATEWVGIALASLATAGVVFAVPNRDPLAQHQDESVQPPDPFKEN